jgi:hypothetical protein
MSKQKRDNRSQLKRCTDRARVGCIPLPDVIARCVHMAAKGRTAPLVSILWSVLAWVATNFLPSDHPTRQLVRSALQTDRRGSLPPPQVRLRVAMSPRSSIPHIAYPAGLPGIHRTLPYGATRPQRLLGPKVPDGYRRRAERYDGKRDLYFKHAA